MKGATVARSSRHISSRRFRTQIGFTTNVIRITAAFLVVLTSIQLNSNVANSDSSQARLTVVCRLTEFVRIGVVNLTDQEATIELSDLNFPSEVELPNELLNIFPIEVGGLTLRDPALTWDIPIPNTRFDELTPSELGDGWQLSLPSWVHVVNGTWGTPPGLTDFNDDSIKPCNGQYQQPAPTSQVAYAVAMVECNEYAFESFSTALSPAEIWNGSSTDFPTGCVLGRLSMPYLITDITDPEEIRSWGFWQSQEQSGPLWSYTHVPTLNQSISKIDVMETGHELQVDWLYTPYLEIEDKIPTVMYGEPECLENQYDARFSHEITVCYLVFKGPPAVWEEVHKSNFDFDQGGQFFLATLQCVSDPVDTSYLAKHSIWGLHYASKAGFFFPGGVTPGECEGISHAGGVVSTLTESRVEDPFDPCGATCGTFYSTPRGTPSLWADTQFYTVLNPIPGYKLVEARWSGEGDYCDSQNVCMKVFFAIEEETAEAMQFAGLDLAISSDTGQISFVALSEETASCTVTRPGSFLNVYTGITCYGFNPFEQVKVTWNSVGGPSAATLTAAWNGRASGIFRPTTIGAGAHTLYVKGQVSEKTVSLPYSVYSITTSAVLDRTPPEGEQYPQYKYNAAASVTLGGFYPDIPVSLSWPDDSEVNLNASGTPDYKGTVTIPFNIPVAPYGLHTVRATQTTSAGTRTVNVQLKVITRTMVNVTSGPVNISNLRVYLYGYVPTDVVAVRLCDSNAQNCNSTPLVSLTIPANGRNTSIITLPANTPPGNYTIQGYKSGRSSSTPFTVLPPPGSSEDPTPKPTKTGTITPTVTPTAVATETATPTAVAETATVELPTPQSTDTPFESPTAPIEPTATETPLANESPEFTPTVPSNETIELTFEDIVGIEFPQSWQVGTSDGGTLEVAQGDNAAVISGEGASLLIVPTREYQSPSVTIDVQIVDGTVGLVFGYQTSGDWYAATLDIETNSVWLLKQSASRTEVIGYWAAPEIVTCSTNRCTLSVATDDFGTVQVIVQSQDQILAEVKSQTSSGTLVGKIGILVLNSSTTYLYHFVSSE